MIICTITSLKQTTTYKDVRSITLPAFSGQMQILPGHAESFILLKQGDIIIQKLQKKQDDIQILKGQCYIRDDAVDIIL